VLSAAESVAITIRQAIVKNVLIIRAAGIILFRMFVLDLERSISSLFRARSILIGVSLMHAGWTILAINSSH
jgi:hypothetical protein